jgi:WD40 repeat protein
MAAVEPYKYWAFISYSHQDKRWGDWLHKKLETYRVPHRLVGREHWSGTIPRRIFPIFRDRDELPSSADLGAIINEALRQSRYQIVICSPRAAASRWVNEEIKHYKSLGRENRLLALIVDGVTDECFPSMLRYKLAADGCLTDEIAHPVAADARVGRDGRDAALLKVIAGLLGLSYDDLRQRERRRQFWRRVQIAGAAAFTLALAFAGTQWFLNREAAQALEARIEKFYDLGRRELLDHHEARAAVYLNEAYKLGRDTPALRFMLGQAMQAIDPLEDIQINTGGPVRRPAFSPDSKSFITPTETADGVIAQIWETATGEQLALLKGLPNAPLVTKFFPDGRRVLVSGFQKEDLEETRGTGAFTGVWDSTNGAELAHYDGHTGRFGQPMDAQARWLVTADAAAGARIWDLSSKKLLRRLDSGARLLAASFSPDGEHVLSGDERGEVRLWNSRIGRVVQQLPGRLSSHVVGTLFTADGKRALAFGARGDVRIWDITSGELLLAYAADSAGFNDILLASSGRQLITVGTEGYKVWDIERGILLFSRDRFLTNWASAALSPDSAFLIIADDMQSTAEMLHLGSRGALLSFERSGPIRASVFSPDGQRLLLASGSGTVELWRTPIRLQRQFSHERQNGKFSSLYAARFDPTEQRVLTASYDGSLRLWDSSSSALLSRIDEGSPVIDAAYSPDGRRLATLTTDGRLQLRDAATLALVSTLKLAPVWAADPLIFSSDSRLLATLPDVSQPVATTVDIWSTEDGRSLMTLQLNCAPSAMAFVPGDRELVTGCINGAIQAWSMETGLRVKTFDGAHTRVWRLAISGDGRHMAAANLDDSEVRQWDAVNGQRLASFNLPSPQFPEAVAYDATGRLLAVGSNTGKVLVGDLASEKLRALGAQTKEVQGVRFLPDGLLLSWRSDGSAKLWDPGRAELLGDAALHDWLVWSATPNRSSTSVLTAGLDGIAAIWDIRSETRTATTIDKRLRCRSPWTLTAGALVLTSTPVKCELGTPSDAP